MFAVLHFLSWTLLLAGSAFCVIGGIGLLRLPDFYTRTHAAGLTDTLGAGLILLGLALQAGDALVGIKLAMVLAFLFFSSPACSHALGRAALSHGLRPRLDGDASDESVESDPMRWDAEEIEEDAPSP